MANIAGIMELYTAYFNRAADTDGVNYWADMMDANSWTLDDVATSFADQTEYTAAYAGLTNAEIVAQVYTNVLNRTADTDGAAYWETQLTDGAVSVSQLIQAVVNAATEMVDGAYVHADDAAIVNKKTAVSQSAYDAGLNLTDIALDTVDADTNADLIVETAAVAAYDAALATYTTAVATAAASKAAADAAASTTVAEATSAKTLADTAATDAAAVLTAAEAMVTAAAATPSAVDNATAAANVASATAAKTVADDAATAAATTLETVTADAEAAAAVGTTFTLTTETDSIFGTSKSDVINAATLTFNDGDVIADSSSVDNDTLTLTATADVANIPTIIGIENVNFNLDAVTSGDGDQEFDIKADNIAAGTLTAAVTKAGSTVTDVSVTGLKSGMTFATDLKAIAVAAVDNADVTINANSTGASTVTVGSATNQIDTAVINAAGNLTLTTSDADESTTIVGAADVTITNATAAGATVSTLLDITADGDVEVKDYSNIGSMTIKSIGGDVLVGSTDNDANQNLTVTTEAGDVDVNDAAAITKTVTITAVGDANDVNDIGDKVANGDISDVNAALAKTVILSATGEITTATLTAATTITATAGEDSTLADITAVEKLTLASTDALGVTFDYTAGNLDKLQTLTFTGTEDVTFAADGADLVTSAAALPASMTKLIAVDNTTDATTTLELVDDNGGAALDLTGFAVDQIVLTTNDVAAADSFKVASGATIVNKVDQATGDLNITAAAVAGNVVNIVIADDKTAGNSTTLNGVTTTNIATVNITTEDTNTVGTVLTTGAIATGAAATVNLKGITDITVASIDSKKLDASTYTGNKKI